MKHIKRFGRAIPASGLKTIVNCKPTIPRPQNAFGGVRVLDPSKPAICLGCHFDWYFKRSWIIDMKYDPTTGWTGECEFWPIVGGERIAREMGIWDKCGVDLKK